MQSDSYFKALLRENRRTLYLALPIVVGLVGQMLMGIADTVMLGHVGVVPLAASAFANTVLMVPMVFGFGLLSAVSVNVSHAHGARNSHLAGESLRGGILLALAMGLLVGAGAHTGLPFLHLLGQPHEVNETVGGYFLLCAWSLLPLLVSGAAKNFCEALGRPWVPFWILMAGVLLNVFLNWILIYGNLGSPAMGIDGASRAKRIPSIVHSALGLTAGVMALFAAGYFLLGNEIAAGFTPDVAVRALTVQLLVLAGVFQIFDGIQVVSSGALRGFADTKIPFLIGIISYWVVALPVSWLAAFQFGFGALGVWVGFVVGLGVAAASMSTRLLRKCKRLNISPSAHPTG